MIESMPPPFLPSRRPASLAAALLTILAAPALAQQNPQAPVAAPHPTVTGVGVAMSGDLLTVSGSSVRLFGIAAPMAGELCETRFGVKYDCYRHATNVLQALIGSNPVRCVVTTTDRTGQQVGVCRVGGTDLAAALVARGWAFAYRRLTPAYVGAEAFAESHRLGMWAGKIETPWQWRSRQLSDTAR